MKRSAEKENCPPKSKSRFQFGEDEDFENLKRGFVPKNTQGDTDKCVKLFEECRKERNAMKYARRSTPISI